MEEFKERGKTFLFVTHGIDLIKNFCGRAIWLMDGSVYQDGDSKDVADKYAVYMNYDMIPEHEKKDNSEKTDKHTDDQGGEFKEIKWEDVSHHPLIGEGGVKINKVAFYEINEYSKKFVRKVECLKGNEKLVFLADVDIKTDVRSPIAAIHVNNDLEAISWKHLFVKIIMHQNEVILSSNLSSQLKWKLYYLYRDCRQPI
jgi:ABC-type glutathione transport system ATPase component